MRKLWGVVLDTLDFMKHAEPLKKIEGLENTVQSLMNQIYECTLFLRGYGDRGFLGGSAACSSISPSKLLAILGRVARDTFTVLTDDAIQQFTDAFTELKTRLRERMDLHSWKIACTMNNGILQLSDYAKRLKEIGEILFI